VIHTFGNCEIDERLFEVRLHGNPTPVAPKVFDTLVYLVRNQDRVVTKSELLDAIWRSCVVGDDAVNQTVRRARRVLRSVIGVALAIQTVRGRGYRFIAHRERALNGEVSAGAHESDRTGDLA
jgi:DNA-binding winged helix-turn-helix (wHTH) protein